MLIRTLHHGDGRGVLICLFGIIVYAGLGQHLTPLKMKDTYPRYIPTLTPESSQSHAAIALKSTDVRPFFAFPSIGSSV